MLERVKMELPPMVSFIAIIGYAFFCLGLFLFTMAFEGLARFKKVITVVRVFTSTTIFTIGIGLMYLYFNLT